MLRGLIAGVLVALVSAGPAAAGGTVRPLDVHLVAYLQHLAGPSFAGDGISWATQADFEGGYDVSVLSGGGTLTTQRVNTYSTGVEWSEAFAASGQAVALAVNVRRCDSPSCRTGTFVYASNVFAGPVGQPLSFQGCGSGDLPESVDLEGTVLAYVSQCGGGVTVRDIARPEASWREFPSHGAVRIAGPYVAMGRSDALTVYDWRSGEEVYTLGGPFASGIFDLRDDGTLVFSARPSELDWASPQEPTAHRISDPGPFDGVKVAGSRVAVRADGRFRAFDLDGSEVASTSAADSTGGFDFDGQRLVFGAQPCEVTSIVEWDLAGDAPALPPGLCPAARLAGRTAAIDLSRRTLTVAPRCPATPGLGCSGEWVAQLYPSGQHTFSAFEALAPGERRQMRLGLSRWQACSFAHRRVRRADVRLDPLYTRREGAPGSHRPVKLTHFRLTGRARGCRR